MTKPVILFMMDSNRNRKWSQYRISSPYRTRKYAFWQGRGTPPAEEELVRRYGRLVRACARPLFLAGGDSEDLFQEGMLGLLTAIRGFERRAGRILPHLCGDLHPKPAATARCARPRAASMPL